MKHKEFVTIPELARKIGLSRIEVYRRVKAGLIPSQRAGRIFLVPKEYCEAITGELDQQIIEKGVDKVIKQYGEVIKNLGDK